MTAKIKVSDLIFTNKESPDLYVCKCQKSCSYCDKHNDITSKTYVNENNTNYKLPYGTVMSFCADRCEENDIFIVLEHTDEYIKCIFPRMRNVDGNVVLGQDKTESNVKYINMPSEKCEKCKLPEPFLNPTVCTECEKNTNFKNESGFMKRDNEDYEYKIFELKSIHHLIYLSPLPKNKINSTDTNVFSYVRNSIKNN
jgi:hypothetical protein